MMRVDDILANERLLTVDHQAIFGAMAPDGRFIALQTEIDHPNIELWDLASQTLKQTIPVPRGGLYRITFSSDSFLLVAGGPNHIYLWDVASGELLVTLNKQLATSIAFSPDGTLMAVGGLADAVSVWGVPASS